MDDLTISAPIPSPPSDDGSRRSGPGKKRERPKPAPARPAAPPAPRAPEETAGGSIDVLA